MRRRAEVFLDTAYAIALSAPTDAFHMRALELADQLENYGTRLVTTRAVLLEIGNALSKRHFRPAAIALLQALDTDPQIQIIPLNEDLYQRAFRLYQDRPDKEWGMIDCVSFVVMEERKITEALTTDEHFRQAGFVPLLRETAPKGLPKKRQVFLSRERITAAVRSVEGRFVKRWRGNVPAFQLFRYFSRH